MTKLSVEAQVKELRKLWMTPKQYKFLLYACFIASPLAFILAYTLASPILFVLGIVLIGLAACLIFTSPHLQNAIGGTYSKISKDALVDMYLNSNIEKNSYQATVSPEREPSWKMEFLPPKGWDPNIKNKKYKAHYIKGVSWPVLISCADGILYPNSIPRKVHTEDDFAKPGDTPNLTAQDFARTPTRSTLSAKEQREELKEIEKRSKFTMSPTMAPTKRQK